MKKFKKIFFSIIVLFLICFCIIFKSLNVSASAINVGFSTWSTTEIQEAFGTFRENNYLNIVEISQLKEIVLTYHRPQDINMGFLYNLGSLDDPDYTLPVSPSDIKRLEIDIYIRQDQNESLYMYDYSIYDFVRPILMKSGADNLECYTNYNMNNNNLLYTLSCGIYNEEEILRGEDFSFTSWYDIDFMLPERFKYHNERVWYYTHELIAINPDNFSIILPNGDYSLYATCRLVGEQDNTLYMYINSEVISLEMIKIMFDFVLPLNIPGDIAEDNFSIGYSQGYSVGYYEGLQTTTEDIQIPFLYGIINSVTQVLNLEIFPNIKLSYFIWLPLCLGIVSLIYHFWRKD